MQQVQWRCESVMREAQTAGRQEKGDSVLSGQEGGCNDLCTASRPPAPFPLLGPDRLETVYDRIRLARLVLLCNVLFCNKCASIKF